MPAAVRKSSGFSVVELLISISLALVIFFAAGNLFQSQMTTVQKLKMKLELTSLYLDVQRSLSVAANCLGSLAPPFAINDSLVNDPNYAVTISSLREMGPTPVTLLQAGQRIPNLSHESIAGPIRAGNIVRMGLDSYLLDIIAPVMDSESKYVYTISLSRIRVTTDPASPLNAKRPVSCRYGTSISVDNCRLVEEIGPVNLDHTVLCAADEVVLTGGGNCIPRTGSEWDEPSSPVDAGYILKSRPVTAGPLSGWQFDCFLPSMVGDFSRSLTTAYCCKR